MSPKKQIIVIGGPTASGKTKLAIEVAQKLGTEIINADSRQIYKELNIGVAKPNEEELKKVPHHFVSCNSIHEHFSAGDFQKQGQIVLNSLLEKFNSAVICGGTGMYIKALIEGLDALPDTDDELRNSIELQFKSIGLWGIKEQLLALDPTAADFVKLDNPARVKRALELVILTGKSLSNIYNKTSQFDHDTAIDYFCIDFPRNELYNRINKRVDIMVQDGLIDEVRSLHPFEHLKALQTVGYSELFDSFNHKYSQEIAIDKIKQHSRNYAKRQITWFKNQFSSKWISSDNPFQSIFAKQ